MTLLLNDNPFTQPIHTLMYSNNETISLIPQYKSEIVLYSTLEFSNHHLFAPSTKRYNAQSRWLTPAMNSLWELTKLTILIMEVVIWSFVKYWTICEGEGYNQAYVTNSKCVGGRVTL